MFFDRSTIISVVDRPPCNFAGCRSNVGDLPILAERTFFIRRINDSAATDQFPRVVEDAIISFSSILVASGI